METSLHIRSLRPGRLSELFLVGRSTEKEVQFLLRNNIVELVDGYVVFRDVSIKPLVEPVGQPLVEPVRQPPSATFFDADPEGDDVVPSQNFTVDPTSGRPIPVTFSGKEGRRVKSFSEWLRVATELRLAGVSLEICDDPWDKTFGFINCETGESYDLPLQALKRPIDAEVLAMLGVQTESELRKIFSTTEGRRSILGLPEEPQNPPEIELSDEEVDELLGSAPSILGDALASILLQGDADQEVPEAAPIVKENPKVPTPPPGWANFSYPKDSERIPLSDANGEPVTDAFRGIFRRRGETLWIVPEGGKLFEAKQDPFSLATAENFSLAGRYKIPGDASFQNVGLTLSPQLQAVSNIKVISELP